LIPGALFLFDFKSPLWGRPHAEIIRRGDDELLRSSAIAVTAPDAANSVLTGTKNVETRLRLPSVAS
jgi:hypothetical protein